MKRYVFATVVVVVAVAMSLVGQAAASTPFSQPRDALRELLEERTPTSRSWLLPTGQRVTQVSSEVEQWQDRKGDWHDATPAFTRAPAGDQWIAQSGATIVRMPQALDSGPSDGVEIETGQGEVLNVQMVGTDDAEAEQAGEGLVYREVANDVDVAFHVVPGGVKEEVLLRSPDARRQLVYRVTTKQPGLDLVIERRTGDVVAERDGRRVFVVPAPVVVDAHGRPSEKDRFELRRLDGLTWELTTVLDDAWLDDKDRSWPVTVDPTILDVATFNSINVEDCLHAFGMFFGAGPTYSTACGSSSAFVGHVYDGANTWWAGYPIMKFSPMTNEPSNDVIASAKLKLYRISSVSPNRSSVGVYALTNPASMIPPGGLGFRHLVGIYDQNRRWGEIPTGAAGPVEADVTDLVSEWQRNFQDARRGTVNNGLVLRQEDRTHLNWPALTLEELREAWICQDQPCDSTWFASTGAPVPAQRPVLEVKSWPGAPAGSKIISPTEGDLTSRRVRLQARAIDSSVSSVRWQYLAGGRGRWSDIPVSALRTNTRATVSSPDIPVTGGAGDRRSNIVMWDLHATPDGDVDGPLHLRAYLTSPTTGHGGMTQEVNFQLRRGGLTRSATTPVGPGELDLSSGKFSMTTEDATFPTYLDDLRLTRTFASRGIPTQVADMFGPGWDSAIEPDGADLPYKVLYNYTRVRDDVVDRVVRDPIRYSVLEWLQCDEETQSCWFEVPGPLWRETTVKEIQHWEFRYAEVVLGDGRHTTFVQTIDPRGQPSGWQPQDDALHGATLQLVDTGTPGVSEFVLTEADGGVAKFRNSTALAPYYQLTSYAKPGASDAQTYSYELEPAGVRLRLKRIDAPVPAGDARWMEFDWTNINGHWRVYQARVGSGRAAGTAVVAYGYDGSARLTSAWDPRVSPARRTTYTYDARNWLTSMTPPGEATWSFGYAAQPGDDVPRLTSVRRPHPDGGTATTTVRYDVPLSGTGAPYDMSVGQTARWDQVDNAIPWDAVAIFAEDYVPPATGTPNWNKAIIHYLDADGRESNLAEPGGVISTAEHESATGNLRRTLSPANRARALAAGATSAQVAQNLSTSYSYSQPDGADLVKTIGPETDVKLRDDIPGRPGTAGTIVRGRRMTTTIYDEGSPGGRRFHLPTRAFSSVLLEDGASQADQHLDRTYGYYQDGDDRGWRYREWTTRIDDPTGRALTSKRFFHPQFPLLEETRTPGGPNDSASPDVAFYRYVGVVPSHPEAFILPCMIAEPVGFLCSQGEGDLALPQKLRRAYTYNSDGLPSIITDSMLMPERLMLLGYDVDNVLISRQVISSRDGATLFDTFTRSPVTGRITRVDNIRDSDTASVTMDYDSNGRVKTYTDAGGTVTRSRYDLRGRVTEQVENGTRTTRIGYDDRDLRTSVTDPDLSVAITATYDPDGQLLTETLPGLQLAQTFDAEGDQTTLTWTKTAGCSSSCVWLRRSILSRDSLGRIIDRETENRTETASYDSASRLIGMDRRNLSSGVCTRASYTFDSGSAGDSNRTSKTLKTSAAGGACGTGSTTTRTWTYDAADRVTNAGWEYDLFGRATAVPAPDSGGTGAFTASYFADDRIKTAELDGRVRSTTRDGSGRAVVVRSSGGGLAASSSTYRYSGEGDSPAAVTTDGVVERYIAGASDQLVAIKQGATVNYQLRDMQGSIVATVPAAGTPTRPSRSSFYDEFGTRLTGSPNVLDPTSVSPGYGWLGAHRRATQFPRSNASPVEMGDRLYIPAIGRFAQVDPVAGGSLNDYEYGNADPLNHSDLDGNKAKKLKHKVCKQKRKQAWCTWTVKIPKQEAKKKSVFDNPIVHSITAYGKTAKGAMDWISDHIHPLNPDSTIDRWIFDHSKTIGNLVGCVLSFKTLGPEGGYEGCSSGIDYNEDK
jgi:RHS repeat-associated protein